MDEYYKTSVHKPCRFELKQATCSRPDAYLAGYADIYKIQRADTRQVLRKQNLPVSDEKYRAQTTGTELV